MSVLYFDILDIAVHRGIGLLISTSALVQDWLRNMEIIGGPLTHEKAPVKYGKIELIPCDYFCRRPRQCLPCRKLQLLEVGIENLLGSQCSVCKFLVPFGPCDPFDRFRDLRSPRVKLCLTGPEFPEPAEGGLSKAFDIGFMCLLNYFSRSSTALPSKTKRG